MQGHSFAVTTFNFPYTHTGTKLRNNLGQFVYIYVPLSPSSITWYWLKDGDVLWWEGDRRPGGK